MTLDETILHAEEVAEEKDMQAGLETDYECYKMSDCERSQCKKCASEHRQLAEWLKDYRRLKEQDPCDDTISRQEVKEQMIKYGFHAPDMTVTEFVEDLPLVIPQPKTGYWIRGKYKDTCNKCRCTYPKNIGFKNYCPNCGAKMVEPQEREK